MELILEPFSAGFMQRALIGGILVGVLSAVVGTWVVLRGMAFLGEAMSHGMLPGVAAAVLLGLPGQLGALVAAGAMAVGVGALTRNRRVASDTAIGILFVGMLALGVLIVSASRSVPINLTAILFGDILAMTWQDVAMIGAVAAIVVAVFAFWYRPFVALTFDRRIAFAMGLRPAVALALLMAGVAVTIVVSYQAVGTLLVVGMLLAPAATGAIWAKKVWQISFIGALVAVFAVTSGLLVSWHFELAAGPAVSLMTVIVFGLSLLLKKFVR